MVEESSKSSAPAEPSSKPAPAAADLSVEVAATFPEEPGLMIRCVHLFGDNYRCNWWGLEGVTKGANNVVGLLVADRRVRKSRFLRVTRTAAGLSVKDVTRTE